MVGVDNLASFLATWRVHEVEKLGTENEIYIIISVFVFHIIYG